MIAPSITLADFARDYLGGRSDKTAKKRIASDGIPHYRDGARILIKQSDAELWREAHQAKTVQTGIKQLLAEIVARTAPGRPA
jgi:hypothetical protein